MTFKRDEHETPVIFRKWPKREGGTIIALFPCEAGSYDEYTCSSYMHVGQHGIADPRQCINATRAAKPAEYADLQKELESAPYGYRLKVYRRYQRDAFLKARREQLARMKAA